MFLHISLVFGETKTGILNVFKVFDAVHEKKQTFTLGFIEARKDYKEQSEEALPHFTEKSIEIAHIDGGIVFTFDKICLCEEELIYQVPKLGLIQDIKFEDVKGSSLEPEIIVDTYGDTIHSLKMTVMTKSKVYYQVERFNRDDPEVLMVSIILEKEVLEEEKKQKQVHTVTVELSELEDEASVVVKKTETDKGDNASANRIREELSKYSKNDFVSVFYPLQYIDPPRVIKLISHLKSSQGDIISDTENSGLLITDRSDYISSMLNILPVIDKPVPQVVIEVKIMEVSWNEEERLGFDWNLGVAEGSQGFPGIAMGGKSNAMTALTNKLQKKSGLNGLLFERVSGTGLNLISAQLEALSRKDKVKLLASTKLKVLNNASATFHAGMKIPVFNVRSAQSNSNNDFNNRHTYHNETNPFSESYQEIGPSGLTSRLTDEAVGSSKLTQTDNYKNINRSISSNTAKNSLNHYYGNGQVNSNALSVAGGMIEVGIKLQVKPRIKRSGEVILDLKPSVSEIGGWRHSTDTPIILERDMQTTLRAMNGDTVLIAGLFKESSTSEDSGVPGLMKIPMLGEFFKKNVTRKVKSEIIFMLYINVLRDV